MKKLLAGALGAAFATMALLAIPPLGGAAGDDTVDRVLDQVERTTGVDVGAVTGVGQPARRRPGTSDRTARQDGPEAYTAPLHGANPHGQGGVAVLDLSPSGTRPLPGDPAQEGVPPQDREEVVVGRARGEQQEDGRYHGHITIVSLFGNEIFGVDTNEGQTARGPLEAINAAIQPLCGAAENQICLDVLTADSSTTPTGSTNRFAVANASVGGQQGVTARAAESNGNIEESSGCQRAHGDSTAAAVTAGGSVAADALTSSSDSSACDDGAQQAETGGRVLGLGGQGVPLPAAGCGAGEPAVIAIPVLLTIVCNATDTVAAPASQASAPYAVRESLTLLAVNSGGASLLKTTTTASESLARAPEAAQAPQAPPEDTPDEPRTPRGPDDPDDPDGPGGPGDPGGPTATPSDPEELALTGADLLLLALMGAMTVGAGLALRQAARGSRAG